MTIDFFLVALLASIPLLLGAMTAAPIAPAKTRKRTRIGIAVRRTLSVFCCLTAATSAWGQVDQEHSFPGSLFQSFNVGWDVQQEFTPSLGALDSVELLFNAGMFDPAPEAGSLSVLIRGGGFDGEVIGVSQSVSLPTGFRGAVIFPFPQRIALMPGERYALQPTGVAATAGFWADANGFDRPGYPNGQLFYGGELREGDYDLVFREGIGLVPEPSPSLLISLGLGATMAFTCWSRSKQRTSGWRERRVSAPVPIDPHRLGVPQPDR